jgi:predicted MFS family arabinose efflux permease
MVGSEMNRRELWHCNKSNERLLESEVFLTVPMHTTLPPAQERWLLITLAGIQFTHIVDFMIMMPLGPQLTALFAISDAQFGLLVSAYTLSAGLSGLLATAFIDRFERKRLLLWLYLLFGLTTLGCALAPSYGWLMAARVAAGLFGGILSAMTQTVIGDVIPFERRGRATGFVMTAFSLASVAGVPAGLFLANHGGWHSAFIALTVLCAGVGGLAAYSLPRLDAHLAQAQGRDVFHALQAVLKDANHRRALLLSGTMMFAGFTIIPYITIYNQANQVLLLSEIPYIYLCGGAVTLFTSRWIGVQTDRLGKRVLFQRMMLLSAIPMTLTTVMQPMPLGWVLLVTTSFFVAMNGRMIPGMALLTSAAQPQYRGTFMSLNGAVQSVSIGLASWVGGLLIQRDAQGQVTHYWLCAVVGVAASLLAYYLAKHVKVHTAEQAAH